MRKLSRIFLAVAGSCLMTPLLRAQGGPPMITDDPGTPGNGRYEINLAISFERNSSQLSLGSPEIDFNYGLGERIQLTLQTSPVILKRNGHGPTGGLGGSEAAVKWRFYDDEASGLRISTFPQIIFNVLQSSVRRGLADDGTRVQTPVEIAKKIGSFSVDAEAGPVASSVGRSEWLYGIVGAKTLNANTQLMAELHGEARMNLGREPTDRERRRSL